MRISFQKKIDSINASIHSLFLKNNEDGSSFYCTGDNGLKPGMDILFVGMNPAGEANDFKKNSITNEEYFIQNCLNINTYNQYYGVYHKHFFDEKGCRNWNIIDLFVQRSKNQSDIKKSINIILKNPDESFMDMKSSFLLDQYQIFLDLVKIIKPNIVIVVNATASRFLKHKFYGDEFCEIGENGYWLMPATGVPILFTQPLSTGSPLDIGSREQLKWNIKRILKEMQNSPNK